MKHFNLCNAYEYIDYEICVPKQNSNKRLDALFCPTVTYVPYSY